MLLKYSQAQKRIKQAGIGKPQRTAGNSHVSVTISSTTATDCGMVKLTSGLMAVGPKIHHRKVIKVASKRPTALHRTPSAVKREQILVDPCENSNDSGLGFDHHLDYHHASSLVSHPALRFSDKEAPWPTEESPEVKRRRLEIKLESDDANDNFSFPETVRQPAPRTICSVPVRGRGRVVVPVAPLTLTSQLSATSHNRVTQLLIVCQPEQQHRARYQTEGSRGAVKDRTGNSFPVVKLVGYDRPTTLQVFIGTDQGRVAPHMFYQACRVSGKNSTACVEKKIDGTIVIEVDVEPSKDMVVTCDCVGILKERNVDVEHRFPEGGSGRSKKKSTRCRMVFRTTITHPDGSLETLQVTSQPIVCTQPPGVPEICKKSLSSCSVRGGQELFVLGKNFLKDTRVVFQEDEGPGPTWAHSVQPDKEFLQQSHLVCVVPPYKTTDIREPVSVRVVVESSGKASEPHLFLYLPVEPDSDHSTVLAPEGTLVSSPVSPQIRYLKGRDVYRGPMLNRRRYRNGGSTGLYPPHQPVAPLLMPAEPAAPFLVTQTSAGTEEKVHPPMMWDKPVDMMMPPPPPPCVPIALRRSSVQMIVPEPLAPEELKREAPDTIVDSPKPMANVSDLSNTQQPSMETFRRFVSNNSLPSINVGNYLSNIEGNSLYPNKVLKSQVMDEMPRIIIPPLSVNKPIFSGDSSNLLTTVDPILVSQSGAIPFDSRNISVNSSSSQSAQDNLGVIVSASIIQKKSPDSQMAQEVQQKQLSQTQSVGMDLLMSSAMNNRVPTMTERLDAFVNSAADSHISPNPSSPMESDITETSVLNPPISEIVTNRSNDMNKLQESNIPPMMPASLQISPHTSPHSRTTNLNDGSLCSLLNSSVQASSPQAHVASGIHAVLEHHLNNSTTPNMNNLIQSPTQVTIEQAQAFSNLQASLGQQLSSPSVTPSLISHTDINSMMQASPQASSSQVQALSNLRASLEQQISPQTVNSTQMNHPDLNSLMQHSPQATATQGQVLSNLQVSLEQQLSSQTMSSSQNNHPGLNSLMHSSPQDSRNEVHVMASLQASLDHLSSQVVSPTQIINSESVQPRDLSLNSMGNVMRTSTQTSASGVQTLSNLQASLECHLTSQGIDSAKADHESLSNGGIVMNSLNSSLPTSSVVQAAVSQAQALSNFQASLVEQHLSSQVMSSVQPVLESMAPSMHSPNINPSLGTSSQSSVSQGQSFSDLQMSLGHLTSRVLTTVQPNIESITTETLSLSNSVEVPSQVQVAVTKAQVLSNLQALEHHLTSQVLSQNQTSAESMMPLERLSNSVQTSPLQSTSQTMSDLQSSLGHLSSQVLSSTRASHSEPLTSHNLSINNPQTVDLLSTQTINVSNTSPVSSPVMSPTSRNSPASVLISPGISMSSTPTMALSPNMSLSPTNLTICNSQPVEMNSSNIALSSSHSLLATDLSMNNPSALSLTPTSLQMQNSQSASLPQNTNSQFGPVASNISQSIPVQLIAMTQYEVNKEPEQKESSSYIMPSQVVSEQTPAPAATVKKCEEGMPLPQELTQMSEHDLISYINPSCFDTV